MAPLGPPEELDNLSEACDGLEGAIGLLGGEANVIRNRPTDRTSVFQRQRERRDRSRRHLVDAGIRYKCLESLAVALPEDFPQPGSQRVWVGRHSYCQHVPGPFPLTLSFRRVRDW